MNKLRHGGAEKYAQGHPATKPGSQTSESMPLTPPLSLSHQGPRLWGSSFRRLALRVHDSEIPKCHDSTTLRV